MTITIKDEALIENALKKVIVELLQEKNEKFISIISEAFEDFVMGEAIKEGLDSDLVSKKEIYDVLNKW